MTKAELEARRLEYEKSIRFVGWDEDCIFSAMNGYDFAAALLQGEIDAKCNFCKNTGEHISPDVVELITITCSKKGCLYGEIKILQNQLQSANAKLAVVCEALEVIMGVDNTYTSKTWAIADEAFKQIDAMDASEGKGKE